MAKPIDAKTRITHIEIRRVQNGFVVMGYDTTYDSYMDAGDQRRVSYVAESPEALGSLIESLATDCTDFVWTASMDLPMTTMTKRVSLEAERIAQKRAEELMKLQNISAVQAAPSTQIQYAIQPNGKIW